MKIWTPPTRWIESESEGHVICVSLFLPLPVGWLERRDMNGVPARVTS